MTVNVLENDSLWGANGKGWDQSEKGFLDTTKGVASANWQYVCHHPYKTAATFLAIATVASLTAAYFLSPAYAAFVDGAAKGVAGWHGALAAYLGTGTAAQYGAGAIMLIGAIAAVGIAYGLYKGAEKVCTRLKNPDVTPNEHEKESLLK
ncbi:hypothetical protein H9I48_01765 [Wolbachia pipientis]|uniref:hypothetical protein n=1 Tax=Wolbachia pipientis TaxID=955 RepID=UPI0016518DE8|nr:hypothetical protein [Wolbachia pipientis]MBC6685976.1 hypothetical protein [Wolbachia pipientis]